MRRLAPWPLSGDDWTAYPSRLACMGKPVRGRRSGLAGPGQVVDCRATGRPRQRAASVAAAGFGSLPGSCRRLLGRNRRLRSGTLSHPGVLLHAAEFGAFRQAGSRVRTPAIRVAGRAPCSMRVLQTSCPGTSSLPAAAPSATSTSPCPASMLVFPVRPSRRDLARRPPPRPRPASVAPAPNALHVLSGCAGRGPRERARSPGG